MYVMRDQSKILCRKANNRGVNYAPDKFVLRFMYKPKEGTLWCFNRPNLSQEYFKEVPSDTHGVAKNPYTDSQSQRFAEEDEENDVDLESTMWLIVRKKRSVNPTLKLFCP